MYIDKSNINGFEANAREVDPCLLCFVAAKVNDKFLPKHLRRIFTFGRKETK
jgi:hypothetical protein